MSLSIAASAVPLRGLYAVTSETLCRSPELLLAAVGNALAGGAQLIQYRDKLNPKALRERNARALRALCRGNRARLIINDDAELAARVGADGLHIGQADVSLEQARAKVGGRAIIGVSCANSIARALSAAAGGADYVAFGRFFVSGTKPDAPPATIDLLRQAREHLSIPICAIGGITAHNAAPLIAAGADLIAAVEGVFAAADVRGAAAAYSVLFMKQSRQDQ